MVAQLAGTPLVLAARIGLDLDPWQARVLTSTSQTMLLNCSRQSGKSTITALLMVLALLTPNKTIVIVSPSERQSKELLRKVFAFWRRLGRPIPYVSVTRVSIELANGSRIEAFPASSSTIRGISAVDLLVADEAGMIPDELYTSVSPMLAVSNGRLVALSTPHGKRGWWFSLWELSPADDPDIERVKVLATECPRISSAFLARERKRIGEHWYQQEYCGEFRETIDQLFSYDDVMASITQSVQPLFA
jgi:hypothetical protein